MTPPRESLLLMPGMMCDDRVWAPQRAALEASFTNVVTCAPTHPDRVDGLAEAVLREAPDRFCLAGHSLGGIVAMAVARLAPHRVRRLMLLSTNPNAESTHRQSRRRAQMNRVQAEGLRKVMEDELLPAYFAHAPERLAEHRTLLLDMAERLGPEVFQHQSRALLHRPEALAALERFGGPTLLLCGSEDRLCPPGFHQAMAQTIPDSQLRIISGAGHFVTLEAPRQTTAALTDWLEETR